MGEVLVFFRRFFFLFINENPSPTKLSLVLWWLS